MASASVGANADVAYSGGNASSLFNLSSPAGWAMFIWSLSVLIILAMLMSL